MWFQLIKPLNIEFTTNPKFIRPWNLNSKMLRWGNPLEIPFPSEICLNWIRTYTLTSEIMKVQMCSWNLTIFVLCSADFVFATLNMDTVWFFISKNFTWMILFGINNVPWSEFQSFEKILTTWKIPLFSKYQMYHQYQVKTSSFWYFALEL